MGWTDRVPVPAVEVTFEDYANYRATDDTGDQAWEDLLPREYLYIFATDGSYLPGTESQVGRGYVEVHDPRRYDIPASVPINAEGQMQVVEIYWTSVMHQLHCLVCCGLSSAFVCGDWELTHNLLGNVENRIDRPEWPIQCRTATQPDMALLRLPCVSNSLDLAGFEWLTFACSSPASHFMCWRHHARTGRGTIR